MISWRLIYANEVFVIYCYALIESLIYIIAQNVIYAILCQI